MDSVPAAPVPMVPVQTVPAPMARDPKAVVHATGTVWMARTRAPSRARRGHSLVNAPMVHVVMASMASRSAARAVVPSGASARLPAAPALARIRRENSSCSAWNPPPSTPRGSRPGSAARGRKSGRGCSGTVEGWSRPVEVRSKPRQVWSKPGQVCGKPRQVWSIPVEGWRKTGEVCSKPRQVWSKPRPGCSAFGHIGRVA